MSKSSEERAEELLQPAPVPSRHEQAKAARGARLWTWIARVVGIALLLAVVAAGAYLAVANAGARLERFELLQQIEDERNLLDAERAKVDALYEQLQGLGEEPIVKPSDPSPGATGPSGPTGEQGIPGRAPTSAEVLEAVNAYCSSIGGCRGADGTPGTPGTNGTNGQPGESVTGPQGPAGAPGANGVGVTGVSCVLRDDLSTAFRFAFSDGSSADVPGACIP